MAAKQNDEEFEDDLANEEHYVYEVSAELEPVMMLVSDWMAREENESDEGCPDDFEALHEKLHKNEELIRMLAKASGTLLDIYYRSKDETKNCNPENENLREELRQITHRNNTLLEQMRELEQQLADADRKVEDLVNDNERLTAASSSVDASARAKLRELKNQNSDLNARISELVSQLNAREQHLVAERQKMKQRMALMQEALAAKEAEMVKLEKSKLTFRKDIRGLNERLLATESEVEELRDSLEKLRMKCDHYKYLFEMSELDKAEYRELLADAKQRLNERSEQDIQETVVHHHTQRPNSPYVDPDSLASELSSHDPTRFDHGTSEYGSTTWQDDTASIPSDDVSLYAPDSDDVDGCARIPDVHYPVNFLSPMGQPGQPGTYDLDMALDRLSLLRHWKRALTRPMQPALTYTQHIAPRIPQSLHFDGDLSTLTDPIANSSLRSTIAFPLTLSFDSSISGLNNIRRVSRSGVAIRDLEEDDDIVAGAGDTGFGRPLFGGATTLRAITWTGSTSPEGESRRSSSRLSEVAGDRTDFVPTPESNGSVGHPRGFPSSGLPPVQGTVVQRANLGKTASSSSTAAQSNPEKLPDCVVS